MRKLITVVALSVLCIGALTCAVLLAAHSVDADTAFLSTVSAGAVVVGLLAILVALLERTHQRMDVPPNRLAGADSHDDRDAVRVREELRAIGFGGVARTSRG
jgi:hypothetical protein